MSDDVQEQPSATDEPVVLDRPGPGRRTAALAAIALAVVIALFVVVLAGSDPSGERAKQSPLIGKLAPATSGDTLDGGSFSIDDQRGRWVAVNFFASWCTPCLKEHPELVAFDEAHRAAGDAVLVSVTVDDSAKDARAFFAKRGGEWPVIHDADSSISVAYGVPQVPETFIVSPTGIVVYRFAGEVTRAELDEVIDHYERGAP